MFSCNFTPILPFAQNAKYDKCHVLKISSNFLYNTLLFCAIFTYVGMHSLANIFPGVMQIGNSNACDAHYNTDGNHCAIQISITYDICTITIPKGSYVFQKLRNFGNISYQIQKVHHHRNAKPDTGTSFCAEKRKYQSKYQPVPFEANSMQNAADSLLSMGSPHRSWT